MKLNTSLAAGVAACVTALYSAAAYASGTNSLPGGPAVNQLNLHPPVTKIASEIAWLHWFMLIICTVIFVGVFGVMFYSVYKHRKSKGAVPAKFHESVTVEVVWTVVPFIIVILMALPATKTVVAMKDTTNADITIKATGYQWKWGYDYLAGEGRGISFLSTLATPRQQVHNEQPKTDTYLLEVDNPVVVPVDRKIRVITTANDVIHAWMVPSFGVKQDAIPGFVRDTWFRAEKVGTYYGQCAELCGKEHAFMPIVVKVVSAEDYAKWVDGEQKKLAAKQDDPNKVWALEELIARGEKVYQANCAACHQANGKGAGPIKALDGSAVVLGPAAEQMKILLNGAGNGAMPAWKQLSDTELAAVTTYTKNAWSNKTGKLVQPADYVAARGGKFPEGGAATASPSAPAAPAATSAAPTAAPAVASSGLPVDVFFDKGQSGLDRAAKAAVKQALDFLSANPSAKVALSGYVDASGNAQANAELAKERAKTVRDALKAAGVKEDRIEMRKPEQITAGASSDKAARRVEIKLVS
jgi:cytochrome c oxidase subunit 2